MKYRGYEKCLSKHVFVIDIPCLLVIHEIHGIVRQDSVFIFGLKTMVADDHAIKVIPIHKKAKRKIKNALEQYFNISELTIYNDPIGFAMANAKLKPIHK